MLCEERGRMAIREYSGRGLSAGGGVGLTDTLTGEATLGETQRG